MSEGAQAHQQQEPLHPLPAGDREQSSEHARAAADRRAQLLAWGGAAVALLIAVALYSRFTIQGNLWRDESIYAYGGQQMADGVPMYVSIFDPKTPWGTIFAGLGAIGGRVVGVDDVLTMRVEFFAFACLTVVAVYLLAVWLWKSPLAGLASAATFASFRGFAVDALGGPDAKTPGILLSVLSMALLVRRRWFWGAFAGSMAFLVWQPLIVYPVVAVAGGLLSSGSEPRWKRFARPLAGAAIPLAATTLYFWIAGGLAQFIQAAFTFPLTGLKRGQETLSMTADQIVRVVNEHYGHTRVLFWGGLILLGVVLVALLVRGRSDIRRAVRDPFLGVVVVTFLGLAAFSLRDFQGYPDLYPLLPYAAIGIGGGVALVEPLVRGVQLRRAAAAVCLAAVALTVALTWHWYSTEPDPGRDLRVERRDAKKLNRLLDPGEKLYALGDPTPLVLTHRRNPSRYLYLGSGVAAWVVKHTPGGVNGWIAQIRAVDPAVIVINTWHGPARNRIQAWARATYGSGTYLGSWLLFVKPAIRARAVRRGIAL